MRRQRVASAPLLLFLGRVVVLSLQDFVAVGRGALGLILQVLGHRGQLLFLFFGELLGLGSKEQAFELLDQRVLFGDRLGLLGQLRLQAEQLVNQILWFSLGLMEQIVPPVHDLSRSRNWRWSG